MTRLTFLLFVFMISTFGLQAQSWGEDCITENERYRHALNEEFANPDESPLTADSLKTFKALPFYPIDTNFCIVTRFEPIISEPFEMATTTTRKPLYKVFGKVTFVLLGDTLTLHIYQNQNLMTREGYENYLFLPFTDLTNGEETYPGGRYIDLRIPLGEMITIDFNKAYNPYCAYNYKYSCPIPPAENALPVRITAGVKYP